MSVIAVGPLTTIDGPLPRPPEFTIWTVAEPIDGRWRAGVNLWDFPPEEVYGFDPCSDGTFRTKYEASATWTNPTFQTFTGYLPIECSTITVDMDRLQRHAQAVFDAKSHVLPERELLLGTIMGGNFVADSTLCPAIVAGAQPAGLALDYLEQDIGTDTDSKGLILCDPATASAWFRNGSLHRVGDQAQTGLGTPVLVSSAFIGQKPDEESAAGAHQSWAWCIGPILAAQGEVRLGDDPMIYTDQATNTFVYRAERDFLVAWDAIGGGAVLVDWCETCTVTT